HPVTEVEKFRSTHFTVPHNLELGDLGRMDRKAAFDSLTGDDAANGEQLARPRAAAGDDHAVENLDALFVPLENAGMNVDGVANGEGEWFGPQAGGFDLRENGGASGRSRHDRNFPFSKCSR